jgi:hypothetical protein
VLGDNVKVGRDKTKITVTSEIPMSKRYLKYLTKKYLKKVGRRYGGSTAAGGAQQDTSSAAARKRICGSSCAWRAGRAVLTLGGCLTSNLGQAVQEEQLRTSWCPSLLAGAPLLTLFCPCPHPCLLLQHNVRDWLRVIASNKDRNGELGSSRELQPAAIAAHKLGRSAACPLLAAGGKQCALPAARPTCHPTRPSSLSYSSLDYCCCFPLLQCTSCATSTLRTRMRTTRMTRSDRATSAR